jgi:hypothetical protein
LTLSEIRSKNSEVFGFADFRWACIPYQNHCTAGKTLCIYLYTTTTSKWLQLLGVSFVTLENIHTVTKKTRQARQNLGRVVSINSTNF